ncbi:MAG: type IV secretion system protein [Burkholderiaceae bacterium]|nr:type IV secretion system protein [Burkholderiaceae bacterium]
MGRDRGLLFFLVALWLAGFVVLLIGWLAGGKAPSGGQQWRSLACLVLCVAVGAGLAVFWIGQQPAVLRFDGQTWFVRPAGVEPGHALEATLLDVGVVLDWQIYALLQVRLALGKRGVATSGGGRWLWVSAQKNSGASWHALRCALYSRPRTGEPV